MASAVSSCVYLIQLEDIRTPESKSGNLWQLDSDQLDSAKTADVAFALKCCSLKDRETWNLESFPKSCVRFFSKVDPKLFHLLLGVISLNTRLNLFRAKQPLLKWAAMLSPGSRVGVWVKHEDLNYKLLSGVIRHAGHLKPHSAGVHFGIELDPVFEGMGTSNGEFRKHNYFECNEDCAVFVSVDKLEVLELLPLSLSDSSYFSDQSAASASQASLSGQMLSGRSVADIVKMCQLAINDRVVWMSDSGPEFGTVRWIGVLPNSAPARDVSQLTVGVEFDNPVGSGTGRYQSRTLFTAKRHHASLVPILGLMKESDLAGVPLRRHVPLNVCADSARSDSCERGTTCDQHNTRAFSDVNRLPDVVKRKPSGQSECQSEVSVIELDVATTFSSVDRKGQVLPPSVADADVLCCVNRGIQSHSDTCSLEAIVFVLFAFYSYFDKELFAKPAETLVGAVKTILVEQIVNPLRVTYFVSSDKMKRFGDLFTSIKAAKLTGCATASVTLADDPSGTITTVLQDLLEVDPLIALLNGSSYVYEVNVSHSTCPCPSLQHIMECSVISNPSRRLQHYPQSIFIVSVDRIATRGRVFPELMLDISGILYSAYHLCYCGRCGTQLCGTCFTTENTREVTDAHKLADFVFCQQCFDKSHSPGSMQDHHPLPLAGSVDGSVSEFEECSPMELFAIVSFVNNHCMSFVKVGVAETSAWLCYDALAGHNKKDGGRVFLPEITRCKEMEAWLGDIPASKRADSLPDIIAKVTSGLRLCLYRPKHVLAIEYC